jgi:mannose-6-phosphate isomerase-like protein (cupin superfamily)
MPVVRAVPTMSLSEKLSVQRLSEGLALSEMRANVFTLAEGSMSRHLHREQEELYLVLDGTALVDVDDTKHQLHERDALAVPAKAWHRVTNVGVGPLTFLVIAAPPAQGDAELEP